MKNEMSKVDTFLEKYFSSESFNKDMSILFSENENRIILECLNYVSSSFSKMKYILGLALDFLLLSKKMSDYEPSFKIFQRDLTFEKITSVFSLVEKRGKTKANTLTLSFKEHTKGIRKIEEDVAKFFHSLGRSDYPSAYVYNTGQWQKYKDLFVECFKLSESAKFALCKKLIDYGLEQMKENQFYSSKDQRPRSFEKIISEYPRTAKNENGGLTFQAMAYGFAMADYSHLFITADKVRTGSSRQRRIGDIDCYFGIHLELSIEVKDFKITESNFEKELGEFCRDCKRSNIKGIAFLIDLEETLDSQLEAHGISAFTEERLLEHVAPWDWHKQERAVQAMLHYIAHIEQNPSAVERLLSFLGSSLASNGKEEVP